MYVLLQLDAPVGEFSKGSALFELCLECISID